MFGKWAAAAIDVAQEKLEDSSDDGEQQAVEIEASETGWLMRGSWGASGQDLSSEYRDLIRQGDSAILHPDAASCEYLFVPGLMTERYGSAYCERNRNQLEKLGLSFKTVIMDTDASVATNAEAVRTALLSAEKPVIIFGHSKGGVDALAALLKYPELQNRVRGLLLVQSPVGGTHVAELIASSSIAVAAAKHVLESLLKGDVDAVLDLSYPKRKNFFKEYSTMPKVPTICFSTTVQGGPMGVVASFLKSKYGVDSDGLVPEEDSLLPGAAVVRVHGVDHGSSVGLLHSLSQGLQLFADQEETTFFDTPELITQSLITLVLGMQQ